MGAIYSEPLKCNTSSQTLQNSNHSLLSQDNNVITDKIDVMTQDNSEIREESGGKNKPTINLSKSNVALDDTNEKEYENMNDVKPCSNKKINLGPTLDALQKYVDNRNNMRKISIIEESCSIKNDTKSSSVKDLSSQSQIDNTNNVSINQQTSEKNDSSCKLKSIEQSESQQRQLTEKSQCANKKIEEPESCKLVEQSEKSQNCNSMMPIEQPEKIQSSKFEEQPEKSKCYSTQKQQNSQSQCDLSNSKIKNIKSNLSSCDQQKSLVSQENCSNKIDSNMNGESKTDSSQFDDIISNEIKKLKAYYDSEKSKYVCPKKSNIFTKPINKSQNDKIESSPSQIEQCYSNRNSQLSCSPTDNNMNNIEEDEKRLKCSKLKETSIYLLGISSSASMNRIRNFTDFVSKFHENNLNKSKHSKSQSDCKKRSDNVSNDTNNKFSQFAIECLDAHNRFRALHNCPPLQLNSKLCNLATNWAKNISRSKTIRRDDNNVYGENMYISVNMHIQGCTPVESWYKEISKYDFNNPSFHPNTGHFTQVIWKKSKQIGVGMITKDKSTWVVVYYNPPGNLVNKFHSNIPQLIE